MSDHRHTLATFLRTDRYRLAALLEETWSPAVAGRLTDHLRHAAQVEAVYLRGTHSQDPALQARVAAPAPATAAEAEALLESETASLLDAIAGVSHDRLHAPVLDPLERGLSVLGHLYDLCRARAHLAGWIEGQRAAAGKAGDEERLAGLVGRGSSTER